MSPSWSTSSRRPMRWPKPSRPAADDAELQAELGDVLLQVVLHARLAEERGAFDLRRRRPRPHCQDGPPQPACVPARRLAAGLLPGHGGGDRPEVGRRQEGRKAGTAGSASTGSRTPCRPWPGPRSSWTGPTRAGAARRADRAGPPVDACRDPGTEAELGELLLAVVGVRPRQGFDAERALRGRRPPFQDSQQHRRRHHDVRGG